MYLSIFHKVQQKLSEAIRRHTNYTKPYLPLEARKHFAVL